IHLCGGEQEAAPALLAVTAAATARETAQVPAQMFEPAFSQVGGAQAVPPPRRESEEGQHPLQFRLEFLHHLRRRPSPPGADPPGPVASLSFVLRLPDPPELPPKLAP